jgi:hypothetical protein
MSCVFCPLPHTGVSHLFAIICYTYWLSFIHSRRPDKFKFKTSSQAALQASGILAALGCGLVPLLQLTIRVTEQVTPLSPAGALAPHEWAGGCGKWVLGGEAGGGRGGGGEGWLVVGAADRGASGAGRWRKEDRLGRGRRRLGAVVASRPVIASSFFDWAV